METQQRNEKAWEERYEYLAVVETEKGNYVCTMFELEKVITTAMYHGAEFKVKTYLKNQLISREGKQ